MKEDSNVLLSITSKAATAAEQKKRDEIARKMQERIEADEARQAMRREAKEKQLAYRANKRAKRDEARLAEQVLDGCCTDLELALDQKIGAKDHVALAQVELQVKLNKLQEISDRYYKAKAEMEAMEGRIQKARSKVEDAQTATDATIVEQKSQNLREAWNNSRRAWDRIQKAVRKKSEDRALKKRAKKLLGL